jgi:hypothetical protein
MAISYAVVPLAKPNRPSKQLHCPLGRLRTDLTHDEVSAALHAYVSRAITASPVISSERIQPWRRSSTAAMRCLAWMEGKPGAIARETVIAALPQGMADHQIAQIVRIWVEAHLVRRTLWYVAADSALRPRSTARLCGIPISYRQG